MNEKKQCLIFSYFKDLKQELKEIDSMLKNTSVFNSNIINSNIDNDILSQLNMGYSSDGQMTSGYSSAIDKLASAYNEATAEANALKMAQDGLSESTTKDILAKQNWSKSEINAAVSSNVFKTAQVGSTGAMNANTSATLKDIAVTKAWSAVKKAASILGGMAFAAAITIGITALTKLADKLIVTKKELKDASDTAKQSIDNIKDSFEQLETTTNDIKDRYAELAQGVDQLTGKNLKLSDDEYEEFLNLSNQLAELFPSLTKNYDENSNAIVGLTGNVNTIVSSLDALVKKEQEIANQKILDEMPDVYAELADNVSEYNRQLNSYKLFEDSMPNNIEVDFLGKTSFKLNDAYYLDKDITKYIKNNFQEKLKEHGLDNAIANTNYGSDGILEFNITGLRNTEEYREKINQIYDEIKADLIKKTQEINSSIKSEMDDFNEYIYAWLSSDIDYTGIDSEGLKTAIQQLLFNSNWINDLPKNIDSTKWNKELEEWLKTNYLDAINNIDDEEYKHKLANLFTMDLDPQQKINLAQELQDYFNQNGIKVSLDFILDGNDPNSEQNLVNRMNANRTQIAAYDPEGYNKLKEYTWDFNESQMNAWLEITKDAKNADDAIRKYEESVNRLANEDFNFFTDDNLEGIDDYKNKISDLSTYLTSINEDGNLSADEISTLNTEYEIFADSIDGYRQAIFNMMNETASSSEIMTALEEAIASCGDEAEKERLQVLYDSLQGIKTEAMQSAYSIYDLEEATSTLESSAALLRELDEVMDKQGFIDTSRANNILSVFPEMEEQVAKYNAGLIESDELFNMLVEAYETDVDNYAKAVAIKMQYDEGYYDQWLSTLPSWVNELAKSYGIDLENYETLNEQKLALDKEYAKRKAKLDSLSIDSEIAKDMSFSTTEALGTDAAAHEKLMKKKYDKYLQAKKEVEDIESLINGIEDSFTADASWKEFGKKESEFGKDSGKDKDGEDSKTEIDWTEQSLKVLEEAVDDAQNALDDTHGFDNQLEAIDNLNGALKKLKNGYKKIKEEYSNRYDFYIGQLKNGETIKSYIESGEKLDLEEYDSDTAEIIQAAIDSYNNMVEYEDKIAELQEQIDDNKKLEKSKVRQEKYETKLAGVQTDLDNDNLSAAEKNALLDKQLKYQQKINAELIKQAKYEGDILEVENLQKEDKKNERDTISEKWQNKINENQTYIDAQNEKLEDGSLTESEIDQTNDIIEGLIKTDYKYKFKDIIAGIEESVWKEYIKNLKKQYKQTKMKDKDFIEEHLEEISQYFNYTGMEELYYEYMNFMDDFVDTDYETHKNTRSYYINDNDNKIANIQSDIDYAGGRGTEQQYLDMQSLHKDSLNYWIAQKEEAQSFLDAQEEGTAKWNEWNQEVQECQENIDSCNRSIKDCEISILKLPLNDIEDALTYIQNQLDDINESINDNNTYISAANYILDEKIKAQEKSKEVIQEEIDRLEKANELRQVNLNLQKAEYALEKARNQRSSKIFKEGVGWVFESDADEIKSAQEQYDQALYDKKIHSLNEQVNVYDEEIARLNNIKEYWNQITTDAQGVCDINKAIAYDSDFINKVLISDASLIANVANSMISLYTTKSLYEEQQSDYQKLQDIINETATQYDLEAIDYEQARQKISNAIQTYYPEVFEKYGTESEKIQEIIDKKLEDAGITEETSEDINTTIDESNEKILDSYTNLQKDLVKVFNKLNLMLDDFSTNAQNMANTISAAISQVQSQLASISSGTTTVSFTSSTTTDDSTSSNNKKQNNKKKTTTKKAGKSHNGLELGYIGESTLSQDKKDFEYIALSELDDNEIVRVLQKGEGVVTESQISQVMSNFRNLAQVKIPTLLPNNTQASQSLNFNGDIIVQCVQDVNSFAKAIKTQLPQKMIQQLYSNK